VIGSITVPTVFAVPFMCGMCGMLGVLTCGRLLTRLAPLRCPRLREALPRELLLSLGLEPVAPP
jgi:hypothetical protein